MVWSGNKAPEQDTEPTKALAAYLEDELERFSNEQIDNLQAVELRSIYASPLRPRAGMVVYTDATKFDPGLGEGWYGRSAGGLWIPLGVLAYREVLTAARTYYVRTDGSDSNSGKVDSAGVAFKTIQKAIDVVCALDLSVYQATIQVRTGSYAENINLKPYLGALAPILIGDTATPTNVQINPAAGVVINQNGCPLRWIVKGFRLTSSNAAGAYSLVVFNGSVLEFANLQFDVAPIQILCSINASVMGNSTSYTITTGATGLHIFCAGSYLQIASTTVTLTGTPAFTVFCQADRLAQVDISGNTYSGAATGQRYVASQTSNINTGGAGATYLPGNVAGAVATQGQYL